MPYCKFCGSALTDSSDSCSKCRARLAGKYLVTDEKPNIDHRKKRIILIVSLALLLVIAVALTIFFVLKNRNDGEERERSAKSVLKNSTILNSTDFSGGYAWIHCQQKNKTPELLLVDADLNIVYRTEYDTDGFHAEFGKTIGYYYNSETGVYTIVNSDGDLLGSSDGGDFDRVLACGETNIFVYRDDSDYNSTKNVYSFMDDTGEYTTKALTLDGSNKSHPLTDVTYAGCDMYTIHSYYYNAGSLYYKNEGAFVNSKTGTITKFYADEAYCEPYFINNQVTLTTADTDKAVFVNDDSTGRSVAVIDTEGNVVHTSGYGGSDFHVKVIKNNMVTWPREDGWYYTNYETTVSFIDFTQDIWIDSEDYRDCKDFSVTAFENNMCMIKFEGQDEKYYFSVIDSEGTVIIPPTLCIDASFGDGIVVYSTANYNSASTISAIDIKGNLLFEGKQFGSSAKPFEFHNGIGRVNDTTFVDTAGNVIIGNSNNEE